MSFHSLQLQDIQQKLSRIALSTRDSQSDVSRLDRMREYSSALSARNAQMRSSVSLSTLTGDTKAATPRQQTQSPVKTAGKSSIPMTTETMCNPCNRDNVQREAAGYCIECSEYFCETCLKHHRKLKITRNHTTQDRKHMPKQICQQTIEEETIEICGLHNDELVRYFCTDHDEPTCAVCATVKHRACNQVVYIPEIKPTDTDKSYVNTVKRVHSLVSKFEKARDRTENNLSALDTQQSDYQQTLLTLHHDILHLLQRLEQEATRSMERVYEHEHGFLSARLHKCNDAIKSLELATTQLEDAKKTGVKSKMFLQMKKITKQMSRKEELLTDIVSKNKSPLQFSFQVDNGVDDFVQNLESLGDLDIPQKPVRTITTLTEFKVSSRTDPECDITGSCVMNDGRIILADNRNKNIKVVNSNYKVVSQSKLSSAPWDVCCISSEQVVVSLPNEMKLQLFSLSSTIHPLKKIGNQPAVKTGNQYHGVAYLQNRLYVTCPKDEPPNVKILDMNGKLVQQITEFIMEESLFQKPVYVTVSPDSKVMYVSDRGTCSIIAIRLNEDGTCRANTEYSIPDGTSSTVYNVPNGSRTSEYRQYAILDGSRHEDYRMNQSDQYHHHHDDGSIQYRIPDDSCPGALFLQADGDMYLCGGNTDAVLKLTLAPVSEPHHGRFTQAITSEAGLACPQSISYCSHNRRLVVSMHKSNIVKVFQMS